MAKHRPDLLGEDHSVSTVTEALAAPVGVWCGRFAGKNLFASVEDRAVVIGPPGTGKTAFLVAQLLHWAESSQPFVCLDIKPEIYGIVREALEARGYELLTYNPTSRTGQRYNPLQDLDGPEAVGELAAALVPADEAENAVFNESARDLLDGIISHLRAVKGRTPTLPDVRALVSGCDDHKTLLGILFESPDADARDLAAGLSMVGRNERLMGSIFATLRANLRFLRYPAVRESLDASDFSLSVLTTGRPVGLFLQFEERHQETTARLLAMLVGHLLRYLITHGQRPPVLLLLDEIGNAPPVPGLVQKLNTIRSRQLPTWLYWQSLEQMQRYGQKANEGPNVILGACDFQAVFRLNDNASAEWMSKRIGVVDRVVESTSVTYDDWIPTRSASESLVQEPRIFPHELQQLPGGVAVCTYRGLAWRGQAMPYFDLWPEYRGRRPAPGTELGAGYPTLVM